MIEYFPYEVLGALITAAIVAVVVFVLFRKKFERSDKEDIHKLEQLVNVFIDTQRTSNDLLNKSLSDMTNSTNSMCAAMQEVTTGVTKMTLKVDELLQETAIESLKKGNKKDG